MKYLATFILLINGIFTISGQEKSVLDCWVESYKPKFDVLLQLHNLEKQLIDLKILDGTLHSDYQQLSQKLIAGEIEETDLNKIVIEQPIASHHFHECSKKVYQTKQDSIRLKYGILFSFYLTESVGYAMIRLEIQASNKILVEGEEVTMDNLLDVLQLAKEKLVKEGISREEIIISLKVAEEVDMSVAADIQKVLRESHLKTRN